MKEIVEEIIEKNTNALGGERHKHPSFGMLSFSHISGGDPNLYGSGIRHNHKIQMTLKRGEYDRSMNQEWYFGKEKLVEVEMSYTQFANLITSFNMGDGVPVTLRYVNGKEMPPCPYHNPVETHKKEFKEDMQKAYDQTAQLIDRVSELFSKKGNLNKAEKDDIQATLRQIRQAIGSNQEFQLNQFHRKMDQIVAEGKGEIEAFAQNRMRSLAERALAAHAEELPQISVDFSDIASETSTTPTSG